MQSTPAPTDAPDPAHALLPARAVVRPATRPTAMATTTAVAGTAAPATRGPIEARVGITVRPATLADVAFLDKIQKAHGRELGFLPTMAIEGKIKLGQVLVAENGERVGSVRREENDADSSALTPHTSPLHPLLLQPLPFPSAISSPRTPAAAALWFGGPPKPEVMTDDECAERAEAKAAAKAATRAAVRIDPRLTAMARELRDRWSEQADTVPALPGKYDLRRTMNGKPQTATIGDASAMQKRLAA